MQILGLPWPYGSFFKSAKEPHHIVNCGVMDSEIRLRAVKGK